MTPPQQQASASQATQVSTPPPAGKAAPSPMEAPAPQTMTSAISDIVTKNAPFYVTDDGCNRWTLPAGKYAVGSEPGECCATTYAPIAEQVLVEKRDCCGVGAFKSRYLLSPGNDHTLPSQACGCGND